MHEICAYNMNFHLGVVQRLRGPNFSLFRPPPTYSGQTWTFQVPTTFCGQFPPPPFGNETPYIVFRGDKYGKMSSKVESLIFSVLNISNKGFLLKPNTTIAWKLISHRSKINNNWNPPHLVPLHRFFKKKLSCVMVGECKNSFTVSMYIQTHFIMCSWHKKTKLWIYESCFDESKVLQIVFFSSNKVSKTSKTVFHWKNHVTKRYKLSWSDSLWFGTFI